MTEDSYLNNYLLRKQHKPKIKPESPRQRSKLTGKSPRVWLKPNKFKNKFMEVTKPPSLVVRKVDTQISAKIKADNCVDQPCHEMNNVEDKANQTDSDFFEIPHEKKPPASLGHIKAAWPEKQNSNDRLRNTLFKLSQKFKQNSSTAQKNLSAATSKTTNSNIKNNALSFCSSLGSFSSKTKARISCDSVPSSQNKPTWDGKQETKTEDFIEIQKIIKNEAEDEPNSRKENEIVNAAEAEIICAAEDEILKAAKGKLINAREGETINAAEGEIVCPAENKIKSPAEDEVICPAEGETTCAAEDETTCAAEGETTCAAEGETTCAAEDEVICPAEGETTSAAEGETTCAAEDETTCAAEDEILKTAEGEIVCPAGAEIVYAAEGKILSATKGEILITTEGKINKSSDVEETNSKNIKYFNTVDTNCQQLLNYEKDEACSISTALPASRPHCPRHTSEGSDDDSQTSSSTSKQLKDIDILSIANNCNYNMSSGSTDVGSSPTQSREANENESSRENESTKQSNKVDQSKSQTYNSDSEHIMEKVSDVFSGASEVKDDDRRVASAKSRFSCSSKSSAVSRQSLKTETKVRDVKRENKLRSNTVSPEVEMFSLKSSSGDGMGDLHCSKVYSPNGRISSLTNRNSAGKESSLSGKDLPHDETPVRGVKQRMSLLFDVPYKATLVKKETNVGVKVHIERKKREHIFGIPQIINLSSTNKPSKRSLPRPRRNSILEFFQNKISSKDSINNIYADSKSTTSGNPLDKMKVEPERSTLHAKYNVKEAERSKPEENTKKPNNISPPGGTPISTPKIFRRRLVNPDDKHAPDSIANSATYQLNETSPLSRKLEELEFKKRAKKMKNLPTLLIDCETLPHANENENEEISKEKTYKKPVPAILKLRKNILGTKLFNSNDLKKHKAPKTNNKKVSSLTFIPKTVSCKQIQTDGSSVKVKENERTGSCIPVLRLQTPLFPSVMQELRENENTVKWTNKLGNVFEVTEQNGKYGNISCYKDLNSTHHQSNLPRSSLNSKKQWPPDRNKKDLSKKMWKTLSDSPSNHCTKIRPVAQKKKALREGNPLPAQEPKHNMIVVYSNGFGNEVTYQC